MSASYPNARNRQQSFACHSHTVYFTCRSPSATSVDKCIAIGYYYGQRLLNLRLNRAEREQKERLCSLLDLYGVQEDSSVPQKRSSMLQ